MRRLVKMQVEYMKRVSSMVDHGVFYGWNVLLNEMRQRPSLSSFDLHESVSEESDEVVDENEVLCFHRKIKTFYANALK